MKSENKKDMESYFNDILDRLKSKDPQFELKIEFGKLLMKHIDDLTPDERKRYDELKLILKDFS